MGPQPLIRPMRDGDAAAAARIQASAPGASQWDPRGYLAFDAWVIEADNEIAGFLAARRTAPDEAEILNLAIEPRFRRRGFARRLLEYALLRQPLTLYLEVRASNAPARALYASLGFTEYGRRPAYYSHPAEDAILMRRLAPA